MRQDLKEQRGRATRFPLARFPCDFSGATSAAGVLGRTERRRCGKSENRTRTCRLASTFSIRHFPNYRSSRALASFQNIRMKAAAVCGTQAFPVTWKWKIGRQWQEKLGKRRAKQNRRKQNKTEIQGKP